MLSISDETVIRLHPLERDALDALLALTDKEFSPRDLGILRRQFGMAIILTRKMTGHGFYTEFGVPENVTRLADNRSFWFGTVYAEVPGLAQGAGFQLHIKDGAADTLEGFCFDEHWPDPWPGQYSEAETYSIVGW
jgi:hypothetical protein